MPKKFLNRIFESAGFGGKSEDKTNSKTTDLKIVADAVNSVRTWDQLDTAKRLIINFIKKHNIKSESPEYKYVVRLYQLNKKLIRSRMDEGDDDIERLSPIIRNIIRESLEWSDKDEYWSNDRNYDSDENWQTDPYWTNDQNWVQGDAGGSDDGGSDDGEFGSGGDEGDYDSFMSEDDDFKWIEDIKPREHGDLRVGDVMYIGSEHNPRYILKIIDIGPCKNFSEWEDECTENNDIAIYEILKTDNRDEPVGMVQPIDLNYVRDLIVRAYWKYQSKVE